MNRKYDFIRQVMRGRSIGRILINWLIEEHCRDLHGTMIDLAAGGEPSYRRYWDIRSTTFITTDYDKGKSVDVVQDLNQPLQFKDNYADVMFLFNAIYIVRDPVNVLKEVHRVLKPNGQFFMTTPLIFSESKEPHDYWRFTSEGTEQILLGAGFSRYQIIPIGERFTAIAFLLHPFFYFKIVRLAAYRLAIFLDKCIPSKLRRMHPTPIGYFVIAQK
jgi:SAM-dependent methyltransferase